MVPSHRPALDLPLRSGRPVLGTELGCEGVVLRPSPGSAWSLSRNDVLMVEVGADGDLSCDLLPVALDSTKIDALYGLLGEFCHNVRNRLNSLKLGLYLARRFDPDLDATRWRPLEREYLELE